MQIGSSYVKAFESYRLTERQTDRQTLPKLYTYTTPLHGWSKKLQQHCNIISVQGVTASGHGDSRGLRECLPLLIGKRITADARLTAANQRVNRCSHSILWQAELTFIPFFGYPK